MPVVLPAWAACFRCLCICVEDLPVMTEKQADSVLTAENFRQVTYRHGYLPRVFCTAGTNAYIAIDSRKSQRHDRTAFAGRFVQASEAGLFKHLRPAGSGSSV